MPFKSKKQRGYLWAHYPEIAREFEEKTKHIKSLPEHAKKKKKEPAKPRGYD